MKYHMKNNFRKGFTLIEILIVVAIIAILATVVLVGLGPTQQSGRDARRLSDLREVQTGLQIYFNKCGVYPNTNGGATGCATEGDEWASMARALTTDVSVGINSVPNDPLNITAGKAPTYYYAAPAGGTTYVIGAILENGSNVAFNNYTPPSPTPFGGTSYGFGDPAPTGVSLDCSIASKMYCLSL